MNLGYATVSDPLQTGALHDIEQNEEGKISKEYYVDLTRNVLTIVHLVCYDLH